MKTSKSNIAREFLGLVDSIRTCYEQWDGECIVAKNEALLRTGVSRAYYSAFLAARDELGLDYIRNASIHKIVLRRLGEEGLKVVAEQLLQLRRLRNKADYNTLTPLKPRELEYALRLAKQTVDTMAKQGVGMG